jgi:hypothetical protein
MVTWSTLSYATLAVYLPGVIINVLNKLDNLSELSRGLCIHLWV